MKRSRIRPFALGMLLAASAALFERSRMPPRYSADELHLNVARYEALNRALAELLQTVEAA